MTSSGLQKQSGEPSKKLQKKSVVAIIGMGMMGGSIGLAIKKRKLPYQVIGIGRNIQKLKRAKRFGACNEITTNFSEGVKNADLIVICTPVFQIVPMVKKILPFLKPTAVMTDIGSVKSPILKEVSTLSALCSMLSFVGSHPLCGSEKTGVENANSKLYEGATVAICPLFPPSRGVSDRTGSVPLYQEGCPIGRGVVIGKSGGLSLVYKFWRSLGASPLILEPEIHDILVAQTSHLPHILASAFVQMIAHLNRRDSNTKKILAGSFKDFTRIVDSDPSQWAEIVSANKKFLIGAIKSYRDILNRLLSKMEDFPEPYSELETFFSSAKKARQNLLKKLS